MPLFHYMYVLLISNVYGRHCVPNKSAYAKV